MISEYLYMYWKNPGIFIPVCSAIAFTIKLGPLPIYVNAPKKTDAVEIATRIIAFSDVANWTTSEILDKERFCVVNDSAKKLIYVGALSNTLEKIPVDQ